MKLANPTGGVDVNSSYSIPGGRISRGAEGSSIADCSSPIGLQVSQTGHFEVKFSLNVSVAIENRHGRNLSGEERSRES